MGNKGCESEKEGKLIQGRVMGLATVSGNLCFISLEPSLELMNRISKTSVEDKRGNYVFISFCRLLVKGGCMELTALLLLGHDVFVPVMSPWVYFTLHKRKLGQDTIGMCWGPKKDTIWLHPWEAGQRLHGTQCHTSGCSGRWGWGMWSGAWQVPIKHTKSVLVV